MEAEIEQVKREIAAIKFVFGLGGHQNELVDNFRTWSRADEVGLRGYLNNLQTKENLLLQQQLAAVQTSAGILSHSYMLLCSYYISFSYSNLQFYL
jgi:hypothetical protein